MSLSKADRQWVLRQLRKQTEEVRLAFHEALREEAQLAVLQAMTHDHQRQTQ